MRAKEERYSCYLVRQAGPSYRYRPDELLPPVLGVVHPVGGGVDRPGGYRVQGYAVLPDELRGERLYRHPVEVLGQDVPVACVVAIDGRAGADEDDLAVALLLHAVLGRSDEVIRPDEVDSYRAQKGLVGEVKR